jgi:putative endonuclease
MYYVYVLRSEKNNRLYTGCTDNVARRVTEHNSGMSKATKYGRPYRLLYHEAAPTKEDALRREKYLKTGRGREELQQILAGC